jgi:3-phosphoshikimate 1-carboxyvinyltransferase
MNLLLHQSQLPIKNNNICISGSKSETNRLLLLKALCSQINLINDSDSNDSVVMKKALFDTSSNSIIDIHHAGTAMRFLTAYFAMQVNKEIVLTGSSRMKERPIGILVDALKQLGAEISYEEMEGYPPLRIKGKKITKHKVEMEGSVSSQYVSALLLIAPFLENGLELILKGEITSKSYIKMTIALLQELGVDVVFEDNHIQIQPLLKVVNPIVFTVESDWSSVSYFYSIIALSEIGTEITISSFKQNSLQGDAALVDIYKLLGVDTQFVGNAIILKKTIRLQDSVIKLDLNNSPDIAQTIAVTCFGLGVSCMLEGLHTLKIKETDRLEALKNELTKLGANISVTNESLFLETNTTINANISIKTYQDHRMAMAFAPLALLTDIVIEDAEVVSKSYPEFWNDLQSIGISMVEKK